MYDYDPRRRSVLRTLALGAGALPVLEPFGRGFGGKAHASAAGAPRRIVLVANPNGLPAGAGIPESWYFRPGKTYAEGKFGFVLSPLERHRDQMVIIQNMEAKVAGRAHQHASIIAYTASPPGREGGPNVCEGPSIDWHMSQKIGKVATPKFPILGTGVQPLANYTYMDDGKGAGGLQNANPYDLYKKLFADLVGGGGGAKEDPALLARLANRKSVLDAVAKDLTAFRARLPAEERARADVQLESIRTLETRLGGLGASTPGAAPMVRKPAEAPAGLEYKVPNSKDAHKLAVIMNDIVVSALASDLTRVVTMMNYGGDYHHSTCNFPPVNSGLSFHGLSHGSGGPEPYKRVKTWIASMVADLADKLKAIPEGNGTMLDNTVIYMHQDHGQDHDPWTYQYCTVGGKNLGIKVGANHVCGQPRQGGGMEHCRMLVSLLHAMGLTEVEKWGKDPGKGPLSGFLV